MLYKILLTIDLQHISTKEINQISEKLSDLKWLNLDEQKSTWKSEKSASDVIAVKFIIERELQLLIRTCRLIELNYAFQLSLGEISMGKLRQFNY
ncbi:MAG: hypothetical protein V4622_07545 [Bacteroidota bacterium]